MWFLSLTVNFSRQSEGGYIDWEIASNLFYVIDGASY